MWKSKASHRGCVLLLSSLLLASCGAKPKAAVNPPHQVVLGSESEETEIAKPAELPAAPAPVPAPTPQSWTFSVPSQARAERTDKIDFHVSLIASPIRVWFFEDRGEVTMIRVVGHSDEQTCSQVSTVLLAAIGEPEAEGFLAYGSGELHASDTSVNGRAAFARLAQDLRFKLEVIAALYNGLEVHVASGDPDLQFSSTPPVPERGTITYGLTDLIGPDEGPAFVPVRSWQSGKAEPIRFEVTAKELGLDDQAFDRFTGTTIDSPPDYRQLFREMFIDALLRGWQPGQKTEAAERVVEQIISRNVPPVWKRVLGELEKSGVSLSTGITGGDLIGPSIFYRVSEKSDGVFIVEPTYIVHGGYVERWSPTRHTVLIDRVFE